MSDEDIQNWVLNHPGDCDLKNRCRLPKGHEGLHEVWVDEQVGYVKVPT